MATTTILHIGEDVCQRIPVMNNAGFLVLQAGESIPAIHSAFADGDGFSAIIFHNDIVGVSEETIAETRTLSAAPIVLFQNPTVISNESDFDLVVPALTPPDIWLEKLRELIQAAREIREQSLQLRSGCATERSRSQVLRARSLRNRIQPIDPDALWRAESDSPPDPKPPEESRPGDVRAKAS